jgi:hypothetical protein
MIDPTTIAVPPTPTDTSTAQEWATYMTWARAMSDFALAEASEKQAAAQVEAAKIVSETPPHADELQARADMTAAINALAEATGKPAGLPLADFVEVLRLVLAK